MCQPRSCVQFSIWVKGTPPDVADPFCASVTLHEHKCDRTAASGSCTSGCLVFVEEGLTTAAWRQITHVFRGYVAAAQPVRHVCVCVTMQLLHASVGTPAEGGASA